MFPLYDNRQTVSTLLCTLRILAINRRNDFNTTGMIIIYRYLRLRANLAMIPRTSVLHRPCNRHLNVLGEMTLLHRFPGHGRYLLRRVIKLRSQERQGTPHRHRRLTPSTPQRCIGSILLRGRYLCCRSTGRERGWVGGKRGILLL